jgi:hypothetical protein
MKRSLFNAFGVGAMLMVFGLFTPATSNAEVNVNINIPLPGVVISAPPAMIVIPGTYVYYPPEVSVDIFFHHGYWYRPYRGGWYIANGYNGPWRGIGPRRVPRALIEVPPTYRRVPPGHERMPYGQVKKNWRTWEKERHWDGPSGERGERGGRGEHDGREHGRGRDHDHDRGRHEGN